MSDGLDPRPGPVRARRRLVLASVCLLGLLVAPLAGALAQELFRMGPSGGPGGGPFDDGGAIASPSRVHEVRVRHGSWIDAVQMVHESQGRVRELPRHGGQGGRETRFTLRPGEYIRMIYGRYGRFVDSITIVTNQRASPRFGGPGGSVDYRYEAPEGYAIVGFVGRSGIYLDSIGVVLARRRR